MLKFITWNLGDNGRKRSDHPLAKRSEIIKAILSQNNPDIIILQEAYGPKSELFPNYFLEVLEPGITMGAGVRIFYNAQKFQKPAGLIRGRGNKSLICQFILKGEMFIFNLAAVHFHSKRNNSERQQMYKSRAIVEQIEQFEKNMGSLNTVLAGDFNHNPYDRNLNDPYFINSYESAHLLENNKVRNRIGVTDNNYWYNPMWNLLGDFDFQNTESRRPAGTFYYLNTDETPTWNLFDGFIVRPHLMKKINFKETKIIHSCEIRNAINHNTTTLSLINSRSENEGESLINDCISDHLPVKFALNY